MCITVQLYIIKYTIQFLSSREKEVYGGVLCTIVQLYIIKYTI